MRCFARFDHCWSSPHSSTQIARARVESVDGQAPKFILESKHKPEPKPSPPVTLPPAKARPPEPSDAQLSPAGPSGHAVGPPAPAYSGRRARLRARLGLSRGGGWVVTSGMLCLVLLYAACATGQLDARGPVVQRILAVCTLVLALCLTPHSGIGFRAKAARAIAPVIPRPIRVKFLDGSTLMLHERPPHGIASPCLLDREYLDSPAGDGQASPRSPSSRLHHRASEISTATAAECSVIAEVTKALRVNPPPELPSPGILDVQLLRFVREHGHKPAVVEKKYRAAVRYKVDNLSTPIMQVLRPIAESRWMASIEMPDGEWATQYCPIGMHCGFSLSGCPVKIERLGQFNLKGIQQAPQYRKKLNGFYLGLVDCLQRRLDHASVETGVLQQTYEIFDLKGLGTDMITFATLNFTKDVLLAFATHYPTSFRKALVINAPPFVGGAWKLVSTVLPKSVKDKVDIMGSDYMHIIHSELSEEAIFWVQAPNEHLVHAPRRPGEAPPEVCEQTSVEAGAEQLPLAGTPASSGPSLAAAL